MGFVTLASTVVLGIGLGVILAEDCAGCGASYVHKIRYPAFIGFHEIQHNRGPWVQGQGNQAGLAQLDGNANSYRPNGTGGFSLYSLTLAKAMFPFQIEAWATCTNGFRRPVASGVCSGTRPDCIGTGLCSYEIGFDAEIAANPFVGEGAVYFRDSSGVETADPGLAGGNTVSLHTTDSAGCGSGPRIMVIEAGGELMPWYNTIAEFAWECTSCPWH